MRLRLSVLIRATAALAGCAALTALTAIAVLGCAGRTGKAAIAPATRDDFHQVPLVGLTGDAHRLSELLDGRPALLSLWAPWCAPCVKELPELDRLARQVGACHGTVLGVAVGESPATLGAFVRERGLGYPQLTDQSFRLSDALDQHRIPALLVLDAAGRVVYAGGALDRRARQAFSAALAAGPGADRCPPL